MPDTFISDFKNTIEQGEIGLAIKEIRLKDGIAGEHIAIISNEVLDWLIETLDREHVDFDPEFAIHKVSSIYLDCMLSFFYKMRDSMRQSDLLFRK